MYWATRCTARPTFHIYYDTDLVVCDPTAQAIAHNIIELLDVRDLGIYLAYTLGITSAQWSRNSVVHNPEHTCFLQLYNTCV